MPKADWVLDLSGLGPTPQAGVRRILNEFRNRGWKDREGVALAIVRRLQRAKGKRLPLEDVTRHVPRAFLRDNSITLDELRGLLRNLAERSSDPDSMDAR